jgi:hypothetical protein
MRAFWDTAPWSDISEVHTALVIRVKMKAVCTSLIFLLTVVRT